jgi:single-stranded-DNA-specific exonuclease
MKYRLVNPELNSPYLENLLRERGVEDVKEYIKPTQNYLNDPAKLDNIEKGAELYLNVIKRNGNILIVVDSDCDGFTSATIIYQYTKKIAPEIKISYLLHEGKQHGLQDHIDTILDKGDSYDLIILPDSSSNDYKYHEQLKDIRIPALVLDHHLTDVKISDNAVVINNQLSKNYPNKELTGAGVTYQFCRYIDNLLKVDYADYFMDLAAWGIIGDMGSVLEMENRYIIEKGLSNIHNFFFQTLIDKQSYSMNDKVNSTTVAFYIVPLINAMIRVGTMEEKERLFGAFIDGTKKVSSNKRGAKGTEELLAVESARECTNAKNRQNKIKDNAVDSLEAKIYKLGLIDNKVLFVRLDDDDDFPSELNGLVAMQLSAKFKKPTIVARLNEEGFIRGSARGLNESELSDFKTFLTDSGYFEYALGHANAFGCSINNKYLSDFHNYANDKLKDIDFGENVYDVNFISSANNKELEKIVNDLGSYPQLWGQHNPEPLIYIKDINLTPNDIQIIGKNKDTVKFEKFGITYIQFHAKQLIEDLSNLNDIKMEIVGKANINEWMGRITPQVFIEGYEVSDGTYSF